MAIAVWRPVLACESRERLQLGAPASLGGILEEGKAKQRGGAFRYVYLEFDGPVCIEIPAKDTGNAAAPLIEESVIKRV